MQLLLFLAKRREAFNIYIKYYGVKENRPAPPLGATKKSLDFFVGGINLLIIIYVIALFEYSIFFTYNTIFL